MSDNHINPDLAVEVFVLEPLLRYARARILTPSRKVTFAPGCPLPPQAPHPAAWSGVLEPSHVGPLLGEQECLDRDVVLDVGL
jgi:hypothetical protein